LHAHRARSHGDTLRFSQVEKQFFPTDLCKNCRRAASAVFRELREGLILLKLYWIATNLRPWHRACNPLEWGNETPGGDPTNTVSSVVTQVRKVTTNNKALAVPTAASAFYFRSAEQPSRSAQGDGVRRKPLADSSRFSQTEGAEGRRSGRGVIFPALPRRSLRPPSAPSARTSCGQVSESEVPSSSAAGSNSEN
jgi:hypothetical protein